MQVWVMAWRASELLLTALLVDGELQVEVAEQD